MQAQLRRNASLSGNKAPSTPVANAIAQEDDVADDSLLISAGCSMLLLSAFSLALGLDIAKRKPVLISPRSLRKKSVIVLLPMFIGIAYRLIADSLNSEDQAASMALSLSVLLIFAGSSAIFILLSTRNIWLFNVTQPMLIEALDEVLQDKGIEYSLKQGARPGNSFKVPSRIVVDLPTYRTSIRITLSTLGRAWGRLGNRRSQAALLPDFRRALETKNYHSDTAAFPFFLAAMMSAGFFLSSVLAVLSS